MPRKQRHTAKRIWERLREDGFTGGYTVVKDAVRELTQKNQEVFVPLVHRPGEAQVDFGHALAKVNGQLRKVAFFVMALPYSDASFVMTFERECTETFWEGHVRAFEFFKGVPTRITYDNTKVAVSQILGKERRLTQGFLQLKSHYLFDHHFCRVARGNEKGVVEGQVKFTRLNFFVPVPQVRDLAELNAHLRQRCTEDQHRRLRGQPGPKAQLLVEDQKAFLPLPATAFEACRKCSTTASSLSLVRFDGNDYSVPVRWAHHPIVAKGYCERVVLCGDGSEVAQHARIWEAEQVCFEPLHYLALLETKPGAHGSCPAAGRSSSQAPMRQPVRRWCEARSPGWSGARTSGEQDASETADVTMTAAAQVEPRQRRAVHTPTARMENVRAVRTGSLQPERSSVAPGPTRAL